MTLNIHLPLVHIDSMKLFQILICLSPKCDSYQCVFNDIYGSRRIPSLCRAKIASASESETQQTTTIEPNSTVVKFKERSTPKITFRSVGDGNEVAFKKRKLNPEKKKNIRQTDPNKAS